MAPSIEPESPLDVKLTVWLRTRSYDIVRQELFQHPSLDESMLLSASVAQNGTASVSAGAIGPVLSPAIF